MFHALDNIKIGTGGRDSLDSYNLKRSSLTDSVRFIRSPSIGLGINNMKDTWDDDSKVIPISSYASNLALEEGRNNMNSQMSSNNVAQRNLSQMGEASTMVN